MALVCNYCPYLAVCFRITYFRGQQRFKHVEITYNLGQNKIEQQTRTPLRQIKDEAARRPKTRHFPIFDCGGRGGGGVAYGFITSVTPPSASRSPSPLRGHWAPKTQDIYERWYCHRSRHRFFLRIPLKKYVFRRLNTQNCMNVSSIKKEVQEETLHRSRSQDGGNLMIHLLWYFAYPA